MRRAVVVKTVKTYGDTEIGKALENCLVESMNSHELAVVKAECAQLRSEKKEQDDREGVRKYGDDKRWVEIKADLAATYYIKPHGAVYNKVLVAWAMLWFWIGQAYAKLAEMNRT